MFVQCKADYDIQFMYAGKTYIMKPGEIREMSDSFRGLHNSVLKEIIKEVVVEKSHISTTKDKDKPVKIYTMSINELRKMQRFSNRERKKLKIKNLKQEINDEIKSAITKKKKLVTLCMCLKNRNKRAMESIESVVNSKNLKYINFIVVEDKSKHMLDLSKYGKKIKHYVVDTGEKWNRSKLLNYGMKRATTRLVAAWDADFLFAKNFGRIYLGLIKKIDFGKTYLWITTTETSAGFRGLCHFKKGDLYGGFYTYSKKHIETIRGFDESFSGYGYEERDICHRIDFIFNAINKEYSFPSCAGYKYVFSIKDVVYHKSHSDKMRESGNAVVNNNKEKRAEHYEFGISILNQNWGKIDNMLVKDCKTIDQNFNNLVKDKRIVVVGPATSIIGSKQKDLIDSYDLVVRINKAIPVPEQHKEDIGTRTDILYNCMNHMDYCGGEIDFDLCQKEHIKYICCPYPPNNTFVHDIKRFLGLNHGRFSFHHIDTEYYDSLEKHMGTRLNSGIGTILDLLSYEIKELYITGFTFFKGGYYPAYRLQNEKQVMSLMSSTGNHAQQPQKEFIKRLYTNDKRIVVDDILKEILS